LQTLISVVFQLDEAKRYIQDGRFQQLRVALLLLDNAAEIQMDRRIQLDRQRDEPREKIRRQAMALEALAKDQGITTPSISSPELKRLIEWTPPTQAEKWKIDRFYGEKVGYMARDGGPLSEILAIPLKHLHKYRNEAYHSAEVRPKTILTAALILLEVNCQMLLTLTIDSRGRDRNLDTSWLEERFGVRSLYANSSQLKTVVEEIRAELLPDDAIVASMLADHLEDRLAELRSALDFIRSFETFGKDEDTVLRNLPTLNEVRDLEPSKRASPSYSLIDLQMVEDGLTQLRKSSSRIDAFAQFALLEEPLEPLEEIVFGVSSFLDKQLDMAADIARGK
jgi:hypothetical protein